MWVFLVTEVLFFGALFLAYAVYDNWYREAFAAASRHADLKLGTINTGVILTSSLFMALAVHAAQAGKRQMLIVCLALTILFGTAFLAIKFTEYYEDYTERLVPLFSLPFEYDGPAPSTPKSTSIFIF